MELSCDGQLGSRYRRRIFLISGFSRRVLAFSRNVVCLLLVTLLVCGSSLLAVDPNTKIASNRSEVLEITQNTILDPDQMYGRIVIKASNITIDGRGAKVVGSKSDNPKLYTGIGIFAEGVANVTLKNLKVSGWETGLKIVNATGCIVEECDFSNNFHDPGFGWGEQGRRGGIVLERVRKSTLLKNRANHVWDGCVLLESDENTLTKNDFSHTSNTCLKLWTSCRNIISGNTLSHGIRISPGEVHARDSTSVLIESGSNDNRFTQNDCRYGGDGIFVRVLNGWVSTGNHFEGNDCSFANNNGVECWAPRNHFVRNKANHCSYGFWMGGSDQSRLIENEASFNGVLSGNHNSPHLPEKGHAGIVFMFGPSSHCVARGNVCKSNNGAGIAVVGDLASEGKKWKAFHWIIEQNVLHDNRWGLYLKYADWLEIRSNSFSGNRIQEIYDDGGVTRLTVSAASQTATQSEAVGQQSGPVAVLKGPHASVVGDVVKFDAAGSRSTRDLPLTFLWDFGDGSVVSTAQVEHTFRAPGFYRVGVTIQDGVLSDLAWRDFYVVERLPELATEGQAAQWGFIEEPRLNVTYYDVEDTKIAGQRSVHAIISPYHGQRASLRFPAKNHSVSWNLGDQTHLVLWLKTINPNLGWQDVNPVITLVARDGKILRLSPRSDLLGTPSFNEGREGWKYFEVPLKGDEQWKREGDDLSTLDYVTIGVDSWDAQPLQLWLDGLALKRQSDGR